MVMVHELSNGSPEVRLAERDDSPQALGFRGEDEPFRIGVEVRTPGWQKQWLDAAIPEHAPEGGSVEWVAVENEVAHTAKEPVLRVRQLPCGLLHPGFVRLAGDSCDLHRARLEAHHEEDEVPDQSAHGQHLDREEVGRRQAIPMSGQERFPGRLRAALRCWLDALVLENRLDRVAGDFVAEALQPAPDSRVAPGWILVRHADHEGGDIRLSWGATWDSRRRAGV